MNRLVVVGGASAAGKTVLCEWLSREKGIADHRRIHSFAFDLAQRQNRPVKEIFDRWEEFLEEILGQTVKYISARENSVVSDMHFAVQPKADTLVVTGERDEELFLKERFVPSLNAEDFLFLREAGIKLTLILIKVPLQDILERVRKRAEERILFRSLNKEAIEKEIEAERRIYHSLVRELGLQPRVFPNPNGSFDEFCRMVATELSLQYE